MANKINLAHRVGLVAQQGQEPYLSWAIGAGCRLFRADPSWALCEPEPGRFDFDWFKIMRDKVYARGGKIIAGLFTMPLWSDRSQFRIPSWTFDAISTWYSEKMAAAFANYVVAFCKEFPDIETVCFPTETNIRGVWRDPINPLRPRSATAFVELVLKPVMPILKNYGKHVVWGAPTLRGQDYRDNREALMHFRDLRAANDGAIALERPHADFLDIHVYHDKGAAGKNVVQDIKNFFDYFASLGKPIKNPIYITETGFNEGDCFSPWDKFWRRLVGAREYAPEERQARNWKEFLSYIEDEERKYQEALKINPAAKPKIKQAYAYELFDPPDRTKDKNGLMQLNADGTCRPKPAALLLREYWEAA